MDKDFGKDMDRYMGRRRKKGLFSFVQFSVANKKNDSNNKVTQEEIEKLIKSKGVNAECIGESNDNGWKEIKLDETQESRISANEEKSKQDFADIRETKEIGRLVRLSERNANSGNRSSKEGKINNISSEEGNKLEDLRRARRAEQMNSLKGRVMEILFSKKQRKDKDMSEEARDEIRRGAIMKEAERQKNEANEKNKEQADIKKKEPFFSNFIQIRPVAEITKEEEEKLKIEEEQAMKDQIEATNLLQQGEEEAKTNMAANIPSEENNADFSTLFPEEKEIMQSQMQSSENVIGLGKDYKIKIVKN